MKQTAENILGKKSVQQESLPWTWRNQIQGSIVSVQQLSEYFPIDMEPIQTVIKKYPMRITPYYLSLIRQMEDPFWRQSIPSMEEIENDSGCEDPLHEEHQSPVPNLIHRYPDRVLFMVSDQCAMHCRYCMRKRRTGNPFLVTHDTIETGIAYIKNHSKIRDVILSGGDPLMLEDKKLEWILQQVRRIRHVEIIRIHTRIPCVLPQRITRKLAEMIRRYHPVYVNTHFNHPGEITTESKTACSLLADAGIPLGCQTVLLRGVNDSLPVMRRLMKKLIQNRVKPYYLHHPDPVRGTAHFRVSLKTGLRIIKGLHGNISGLCIPRYMIDLPQGGGKVPLQPDYVEEYNSEKLILRNFRGSLFHYPEIL
ncbi:MAG: KamA family radical SAM protein [Desulfobacterales bacterium]